MKKVFTVLFLSGIIHSTNAQKDFTAVINTATAKIEPKCIAWRRQIHANPELGNREVKTAKLIADHLRSLGIEVKEG
jgi:amidohydrolase